METAGADQVSEILDRVKNWPFPSRVALARGILESLEGFPADEARPRPSPESPARGVLVASVVEFLKTDREPPGDEECRRIVEEKHRKKYAPETS